MIKGRRRSSVLQIQAKFLSCLIQQQNYWNYKGAIIREAETIKITFLSVLIVPELCKQKYLFVPLPSKIFNIATVNNLLCIYITLLYQTYPFCHGQWHTKCWPKFYFLFTCNFFSRYYTTGLQCFVIVSTSHSSWCSLN